MKILESRAKWEAISLALACHAQRGMMAGSAVLDVVENVVRHQNLPVKVSHLLPDFRKSGLACCLDVDYPTSNERAVAITVLSDRSSHWIISSSVKTQGERGHGLATAGFEQGLDPTLSRRPVVIKGENRSMDQVQSCLPRASFNPFDLPLYGT